MNVAVSTGEHIRALIAGTIVASALLVLVGAIVACGGLAYTLTGAGLALAALVVAVVWSFWG